MFQRAHDYMYVQHTTLLCSHKTLISSLQANRITAWPVSGNNLLLSYAGALKMTDMKLQDMKLTDRVAGHEIAGHENGGPNSRT